MKKPLVSVILPTYNRSKMVSRAIRSVLYQTYPFFELIIVDDGSTDDTEQVLATFRDKRIQHIRCEKNRGGPTARNMAIKRAKGEYVAFQDSDDEWMPKKLEKHISLFERLPSNYGVVYSDCLVIEDKRRYLISSNYPPKSGFVMDDILNGNFVTMQIVTRRSCLVEEGLFDENLHRLQDWELWIRISQKYHYYYIPEPLTVVYRHKNSLTSNLNELIKSTEFILQKHKKVFQENRHALGKRLAILADMYARKSDFSKAKDIYGKVFPLNKNYKYLLARILLTIFPNRLYNRVVNTFIRYY